MYFLNAYSKLFMMLVLLSAGSLIACASMPSATSTNPEGTSTQATALASLPKANTNTDIVSDASLNNDGQLIFSNEAVIPNSVSSENLWEDIGYNFSLQEHYTHHRVERMLDRYQNNQIYFNRLQPQAKRYLAYIVQEARRRNVPLEVALLPIIESTLNPYAVSSSNAVGMWQFIYSTGKMYNLKNDTWVESRRDIVASTTAGLNHLVDLYYRFDDWLLAMAAYNAGPGGISAAIKANVSAGLPTDYWSLDLSTETMEYIPKILALAEVLSNPLVYNIHLSPISTASDFKRVSMRGKFDLSQLANCAKMHVSEFYRYNPSFNHPQTPNRDFILLIPKDRFQIFSENFQNFHVNCKAQSIKHTQNEMNRVRGFSIKLPSSLANNPASQPSRSNSKPSTSIHIPVKPTTVPKSKPKTTNIKKPTQKPHLPARRPKPASSQTSTRNTSGKQKIIHTVKAGETLWRISFNNGVKISDLMRWNKLNDKTKVTAGSRLVIWK